MRCTNIAKLFPNAVNSRQAQGVTVDSGHCTAGAAARAWRGDHRGEQRAEENNVVPMVCLFIGIYTSCALCKYVRMGKMLGQRG